MSGSPDLTERQAQLENEVREKLDELARLGEQAQHADRDTAREPEHGETAKQDEQPTTVPVPVPADPATLTPEERQKLEELREIEQRGREQLDRQYPPMWNPSKNAEHPSEIAAAQVRRIDVNVGPSRDFGTYAAVIEIRDGQGRDWSIWANKPDSPLWHQLFRLKLQPGDVIALRDLGKRPSKRDPSRQVHDVRMVRVGDDNGPEAIDYDKLERAPQSPPPPERSQSEPDDDIPF
jgi:hypothetical protein